MTVKCSLAALIGRLQTVRFLHICNKHSLTSTDYDSESLREYFTQYGEVTECTVMRDGATGRSRGFGFLTFKDPKTVNVVMVKEHYLNGKIVRDLLVLKQIPNSCS